ncbi:MAG: ribonuclease domain-containing protein [Actinomycetota bacterium]
MSERAPAWLRIVVAVAVALVIGWLLVTDGGDDSDAATGTSVAATELDEGFAVPAPSVGDGGGADAIGVSGLPAASTQDLPPEALEVLDLIETDGPFPYRQDGSTFFNREGLLPFEDEGYYREYTVDTPGSPDRGARRLVTGDRGEVFYTADHYASFVEVVDAGV